jgi:hypothetical protein
MFAKDDEGSLSASTADAVARATEATAFADKLAGKGGLTKTAFLRDVYFSLIELGKTPPKGQDDVKARDLVKELDGLYQHLPDKYPFNGYTTESAGTGAGGAGAGGAGAGGAGAGGAGAGGAGAVTAIKTKPQKDTPVDKSTKDFNSVLDYQNKLLNSIEILQGLVKQPRSSFTVNGNSTTPDINSLQNELAEQKSYLKKFTDEWGRKEVVLKAVDYYISALKK